MNDFEEAINSDLNWRLGEIAILKSLTVQSHLSERKKAIARKYSIPALYAVWEGYIVRITLRPKIRRSDERRIFILLIPAISVVASNWNA